MVRRAWRAMTAGMAISRNRIVRGSQARAGASARASSWEKASRPAGQGHDQAPDAVLSEPLQREAIEAGVFRAADAVLAAGSQPVADLELGELAHFCVGGEGGEPVAAHVLEAQPGALVGPLAAHGSPASPWARRSGPAGRRFSATSAPSPGSPSVLYAGVQAASGMVP